MERGLLDKDESKNDPFVFLGLSQTDFNLNAMSDK